MTNITQRVGQMLDEAKLGTVKLNTGDIVSAREGEGHSYKGQKTMQAYKFSNRAQAEKHALKVGGMVIKPSRVFYVEVNESVEIEEGAKFSAAQLDKLKTQYSSLQKIDPTSQSYKKMKEMMGKMSKEQLQQIKDAKIKFLQYTAGDLLRNMEEEIQEEPANVTGANVAGTGDDPVHWQRKKKKKKPAWEDSRVFMNKFAGKDVFIVDSDMFHDCRMGKKKYHRYEKYVGIKRIGNAIREYGLKFPKRPIILQNGENGPMLFLRYGRS